METKRCTNCDAPIAAPGGRPPKDGNWYCQLKACRAARARNKRRAANDEVGTEDRICCYCLDPQVVRPKRVTDHPLARWCLKPGCQSIRFRMLTAERKGPEAVAKLFAKMAHTMPRTGCPKCGLPNAVPGWGHPVPDTGGEKGCAHFSQFYPLVGQGPEHAWVEEFTSDPELQKKRYDKIERQKERLKHDQY